jgi:hypothetical protein
MNRTSALIVGHGRLVGFAPAPLYAQASSTEKPVRAEKNPRQQSSRTLYSMRSL